MAVAVRLVLLPLLAHAGLALAAAPVPARAPLRGTLAFCRDHVTVPKDPALQALDGARVALCDDARCVAVDVATGAVDVAAPPVAAADDGTTTTTRLRALFGVECPASELRAPTAASCPALVAALGFPLTRLGQVAASPRGDIVTVAEVSPEDGAVLAARLHVYDRAGRRQHRALDVSARSTSLTWVTDRCALAALDVSTSATLPELLLCAPYDRLVTLGPLAPGADVAMGTGPIAWYASGPSELVTWTTTGDGAATIATYALPSGRALTEHTIDLPDARDHGYDGGLARVAGAPLGGAHDVAVTHQRDTLWAIDPRAGTLLRAWASDEVTCPP